MKSVEEMVRASVAKLETPEPTEEVISESPSPDTPSVSEEVPPLNSDVVQAEEPVEETPPVAAKSVDWEKRYNDNNKWAQEQKRRADLLESTATQQAAQLAQLQSLVLEKLSAGQPQNEPAPVEDWDSVSESDRQKLLRQQQEIAKKTLFDLGFDPEVQRVNKARADWDKFYSEDLKTEEERTELLHLFQPMMSVMLEELPEVRRDRDALNRLRKICLRYKEMARAATGTQTEAASKKVNAGVTPPQTLSPQRQEQIRKDADRLKAANKTGTPNTENPKRTVKTVRDMVEASFEKQRARNL